MIILLNELKTCYVNGIITLKKNAFWKRLLSPLFIYYVGTMLLLIFFGYDFITLKLRINLCYILELSRKISKTYKSVTASTGFASNNNVGDRAINSDIDHKKTSNTHDIN